MTFVDTRATLGLPRWVLLVVAIQVMIPLVATFSGPIPSRFGFHMYSGDDLVTYSVVDSTGAPLEVDQPVVGRLRSELPWTSRLPEYLCDHVPGASQVSVSQPGDTRTLKCPD